jgi:hypothetical protein
LIDSLNSVLVNAYHPTYGKEEMGVCSALRIGYMVNYLQGKYLGEWKVRAQGKRPCRHRVQDDGRIKNPVVAGRSIFR